MGTWKEDDGDIVLYNSRDGTEFLRLDQETNDVIRNNLFSDDNALSSISGACVVLNDGTPTAYDSNKTIIESDPDAGIVMQSALDSVGQNGVVFVGAGEFPMQSDVQIDEYQTIIGQGMRGGTTFKATDKCGWFSKNAAIGITIRDFAFDGNNQGGQTRMFLSGAEYSTARNMAILNCGGRGNTNSSGGLAWWNGSSPARGYNRILNCYAENTAHVSLSCQKISHHNIIRGCVVKDPNQSGSFTHPISIESNHHSIMSNNIVIGPGNPSLNANLVEHSVVSNNTIEGAVKGINCANGGGIKMSLITNNTISDTEQFGIVVQNSSTPNPPEELLVANNTIQNTDAEGVKFRNNGHAHVIGNLLINNKTDKPNGAGSLSLTTDKPKIIANNYIRNAQDGGIFTSYNPNKYPDREELIFGNVIIGTKNDRAVQASDGYIFNNYIDGKLWLFSTDSPDTIVKNNVFDGINIRNTDITPIIRNNIGYTTENSGVASVADTGTISHGIAGTPTYVDLTPTTPGHSAAPTTVDSSSITVGLVDSSGTAVTTAEDIYWEARRR